MTIRQADEAARDAAGDSVTFAFGDPATQLYGIARLGLGPAEDGPRRASALALLFAGRQPVAALARGDHDVPAGAGWEALALPALRATVDEPLARWRVAFEGRDGHGFELDYEAAGPPAELAGDDAVALAGGMSGYEQPCRVRGTVRTGGREKRVDCVGQRTRTWGEPDWSRIELARTVTAWTPGGAFATLAGVRPAGARHHAEEALWGALWEPANGQAHDGPGPSSPVELDEARLSTTYDDDGRTRRAGLELWPADADGWARRGAGEVLCGSSLDLGALRLDCAFLRWHLDGREGVGRYEVVRRA